MKDSIVLGICGRARTGKDTFAQLLAEEFYDHAKTRFVIMAYAHELKLRVQRDFDLRYEQLWGDEKEVEDKRYPKKDGGFWTAREILQFMGTECFRAVDNDFWVKNLFKVIEDKNIENVIITDVRFPNEADPIKDRGGYIIKVISDRKNKQKINGHDHVSETAMDDYEVSFEIKNNNKIEDLRVSVRKVVDTILGPKNKDIHKF